MQACGTGTGALSQVWVGGDMVVAVLIVHRENTGIKVRTAGGEYMRMELAYWGRACTEGKKWAYAEGAHVTDRGVEIGGESHMEGREWVLWGWL